MENKIVPVVALARRKGKERKQLDIFKEDRAPVPLLYLGTLCSTTNTNDCTETPETDRESVKRKLLIDDTRTYF